MLVDANCAAAFFACPTGFFVLDEFFDAGLFDVPKVFKHAHVVFFLIALVKMGECRAGKLFTRTAVAEFFAAFFQNRTILYFASDAAKRLGWTVNSAAGTMIFLSQISAANSAVHATGCDK
jgi:hypothetical protein